MSKKLGLDLVSIDGKSVRGSYDQYLRQTNGGYRTPEWGCIAPKATWVKMDVNKIGSGFCGSHFYDFLRHENYKS
ncbi:MAG: hypothetical protein RLZZ490_627 [Cyanobacteriota bacterium]